MSGDKDGYRVQRFRDGHALVWWDTDPETGKRKRRRRQLAARDRASAEKEAADLWREADTGAWTVGKCMTGYLESIEDKPSHQRRVDAWKAMRPFWENIEPAAIDKDMCKRYRKTRPVADATARYEILQLSTALNWARKHIGRDHEIWLPPQAERQVRHLERADFELFLAEVRAPHARLYMFLGVYTMARPGAILALTWDRVDFQRRTISFIKDGHVQTAKKRVVVPMSDELHDVLLEAYHARTCEYVIEYGGGPIQSIKKAFQAASDRSTVHATPYTLRHTGAVWAAEAGVSMEELAQFMGHDDSRTTQKHYARFSPNHLRSVANSIGSVGKVTRLKTG